jgi:hypothetical protein
MGEQEIVTKRYILTLEIDDVVVSALETEARNRGHFTGIETARVILESELIRLGLVPDNYMDTERFYMGALYPKHPMIKTIISND